MKPIVIILVDLELTTIYKDQIKSLLELAYNSKITLVPAIMEPYNKVYYRDKQLESYTGRTYVALNDDTRSIKKFVNDFFEFVQVVLSGRPSIYILHSDDYLKEASMLLSLIEGLEFDSDLAKFSNPDKLLELL